MTYSDLGLARKAYDRVGEEIAALKTGTRQGQMAQELALIIHNGHKPCWSGGYVGCENHMTAHEEEQSWPCDEARKLTMVLGLLFEDTGSGRP